jgi:hypothetical protein
MGVHVKQQICTCGTCADVVERAVQFICKMTDDDECSLFTFAVCEAFALIGEHLAESGADQYGREHGLGGVIAHGLRLNDVHHRVEREYKQGNYYLLINERMAALRKREEERENLPKGD